MRPTRPMKAAAPTTVSIDGPLGWTSSRQARGFTPAADPGRSPEMAATVGWKSFSIHCGAQSSANCGREAVQRTATRLEFMIFAILFTPQALPPRFGNKIDPLAGPMKLLGSSLILFPVRNWTDWLRSCCHHALMPQRKSKRESDKATVRAVRKEMAKPRLTKSSRTGEANLAAARIKRAKRVKTKP